MQFSGSRDRSKSWCSGENWSVSLFFTLVQPLFKRSSSPISLHTLSLQAIAFKPFIKHQLHLLSKTSTSPLLAPFLSPNHRTQTPLTPSNSAPKTPPTASFSIPTPPSPAPHIPAATLPPGLHSRSISITTLPTPPTASLYLLAGLWLYRALILVIF